MTPEPDAAFVVVVSGPSGAGKDTVIQHALARDASLATVATVKTRPPRPGEIDGVHQVFLSEDEFDEWLAADRFLEHAQVYNHRSGVPRAAVEDLLAAGRTVVLRTDVQGRLMRSRGGCGHAPATPRRRSPSGSGSPSLSWRKLSGLMW